MYCMVPIVKADHCVLYTVNNRKKYIYEKYFEIININKRNMHLFTLRTLDLK